MKRRLFAILWVSSLLIFVLLGALWVRSYWYWDSATYRVPGRADVGWFLCQADSGRGVVFLICISAPGQKTGSTGFGFRTGGFLFPTGRWGFGYKRTSMPMWQVNFPHWAPMLAAAILPAVGIARARRRQRRKKLGLCLKCGYDLRASKERPECGMAIPAQL